MLMNSVRLIAALALCAFVPDAEHRAAADEEEMRSGLHGVLSDETHSVVTTADRMSFDWTDAGADARLSHNFKAIWTGNLLVRQPGKHSFHTLISGQVTVAVDDTKVLAASGENIFHTGLPVELSAGDHRIQIRFDSATGTAAKLQLFWSSPDFTLEPLPADALSHEAEDAAENRPTSGRFLADALRCAACHQGLDELPTLKAPSLLQVNQLSPTDVVARLMSPHEVNNDSMMPSFGFSRDEADKVTAFLINAASKEKVLDPAKIKFKAEDADAGTKLLLTSGCVACHVIPQLKLDGRPPQASPYHGPNLADVAARRSEQWLMTWFKSPDVLNTDHRMPVFSFSDDERRQLVAALNSPPASNSAKALTNEEQLDTENAAAVAEGRRLVIAANCAGCHKIAGIEATEPKRMRPGSVKDPAGTRSCIVSAGVVPPATISDLVRQPSFDLTNQQRSDVMAWLHSISEDLRTATNFAKGELLLHRNGCLACHDRDQHQGLSQLAGVIGSKRDDLRGQSQALIPPPLTAVGDKLRDEYLMSAVAGEQSSRRLPWLLVRMPKFGFSPDDRAAIVRYFVGSDRIPDVADVARPELFEHLNPHHPSIASATELLTGNALMGAAGFNCIACHSAGSFEPRNVAMGTRGSDIMTMGQRVRSRYFMRWMQNPIRVVPGIEMPAIRKPIPGVLDDSLPQQIAMMWKALSDAGFQPPTVVSRYEQFVTVSAGQRPRVIRDVFTIGDPKDRNSVARSLAVGFNNGHNVLFDLDSLQLRQWTVGEFARQRTEGKSWFWDMAGVTVTTTKMGLFEPRLKRLSSPSSEPLQPVIDQRRHAELMSYIVTDDSVSLRMRYYFDPGPEAPPKKENNEASRHTAITAWNDPMRKLSSAIIQFTLQPEETSGQSTGWMVTATVEECPDDHAVLLEAWRAKDNPAEIAWSSVINAESNSDSSGVTLANRQQAVIKMVTKVAPTPIVPPTKPASISPADRITSLPGFEGQRLPINTAIMPTAMTWLDDGRMAFTSLRGQVWIARDTDGDKLMDSLTLFAEGLAAPYGIQADGDSLLVSHKPEVLRLRDSDGDAMADEFDVFASGWGFSDDYHDWTTALARDRNSNYFVGLGSDYSQNNRASDNDRWRGTILKLDSAGIVTPVAYSFRFPMGLAFDSHQHLFATDNQGVQNTFNEINHVVPGKHYGVPSRHETEKNVTPEAPSLMIPHPWTRSVNSIVFFPNDYEVPELAGHGVGCEYDTRCLIRFTVQDVNGTLQGASYRFSLPDQPGGGGNFVGPVASAIAPDGTLYIGSIWDSGWQGGSNTGTIERMVPGKTLPNGIREIRATVEGFDISFFHPVDPVKANDPGNWSLQAYTRSWGGSYATPDSDRHPLIPAGITTSNDGRVVSIAASPLKAGYVYEISVKQPLDDAADGQFWPAEGHYSMKVVPQ